MSTSTGLDIGDSVHISQHHAAGRREPDHHRPRLHHRHRRRADRRARRGAAGRRPRRKPRRRAPPRAKPRRPPKARQRRKRARATEPRSGERSSHATSRRSRQSRHRNTPATGTTSASWRWTRSSAAIPLRRGAARFEGQCAEGTVAGEKVLVLKPETYMNKSGRSVGEAVRFYKLAPADVIVIHDEIDLAAGKVRVQGRRRSRRPQRPAQHRRAHRQRTMRRVRLGIGHPGVPEQVHGHVLDDFVESRGRMAGAAAGRHRRRVAAAGRRAIRPSS